MGWLYDVAQRRQEHYGRSGRGSPMPPLRPDRDPPPTAHPGREGLPSGFADSLLLHPATELVAACEVSDARREAFGERYPGAALYADYREMVARERLDIVGISSHAALRPEATRAAVEHGARGVITEKPIAPTLAGADAMVDVCAAAGVPLVVGAVSMNHPALGNARRLLDEGAIGRLLSVDTNLVMAQHNSWNYLLDSPGEWVIGISDDDARVEAGREFKGAGFIRLRSGLPVCLRPGAPWVRITGESGELTFDLVRTAPLARRGDDLGNSARRGSVPRAAAGRQLVRDLRHRRSDRVHRERRRAPRERPARARRDGDRDRAQRVAPARQRARGPSAARPQPGAGVRRVSLNRVVSAQRC